MFDFIKDKDPNLYRKFIKSAILLIILCFCNAFAFVYITSSLKQSKIQIHSEKEMKVWLEQYRSGNIEQIIADTPSLSSKSDISSKTMDISNLLRTGNNVINISNKDTIAKKPEDLSSSDISAIFNTDYYNAIATLENLEKSKYLLSIDSCSIDNSSAMPTVTLNLSLYFK